VLTLARMDEEVLIMIAMFCALGALWLVSAYTKSIITVRQREATRREIAAYVAEGSISASDAATILSAGQDDVRKTIADAVAWGTISAKDAERMLRADGAGAAHPDPSGAGAAPRPAA
jgi:hypothetical protein